MSNNTKKFNVSQRCHSQDRHAAEVVQFESGAGALKCKRRPFFRQLPFTGKKEKHLGNSISIFHDPNTQTSHCLSASFTRVFRISLNLKLLYVQGLTP